MPPGEGGRELRIVYISHGDVPSKWAHSLQSMKMADALAAQALSVELLTAGSLFAGAERRVPLRSWYGIGPGPRIVRLPVFWRRRDPFFAGPPGRRFERAAALYARLRRPDLVYVRSKRAALDCIRLGLPTLVEVHGSPKSGETQRRALEDLVRLAERPALLGVVTVTGYLRDLYRELGFPGRKLEVWPDGVDPAPFDAAPERDEARRRLGLPAAVPIALYCGHFYEAKGAPCLVEAAALAPELTFCLVGGTPRDTAPLRQRAARNVCFEGFVPQHLVPEYLAAADVLVLPNSAQGEHAHATSPLKLFEYMAARRPIVASDIPALEGVLRHGENAWLVEPDSPRALAEGVRAVAADPGRAKELADRARAEVARFTWERRAREILERFAGGG